MTEQEFNKKEAELAQKVMSLSVGKLLLRRHFFSAAVGKLALQQLSGTMLTDGSRLCYDPEFVLERYKQDELLPVHDLLHSLLHNIFRHWSIGVVQPQLWDVCCDIAAEALISEIAPEFVPAVNSEKRAAIIKKLSVEVRPLTAEKLYSHFRKNSILKQLDEYSGLFATDDHRLWHKQPDQDREYEDEKYDTMPVSDSDEEDTDANGDERQDPDENSESEQTENRENNDQGQGKSQNANSDSSAVEQWMEQQHSSCIKELEDQWKDIAKQIQSEVESFKAADSSQLPLVEVLEHIDREKTDYRAFLRRFAVTGEVMKSDLDSFDVNFYCYAMDLYGDVAFIEPPEYKEIKRIKDFVIAIDTSGSVGKKTVKTFVQKTYSILKNEESFFSRVNIHILQCDTMIRDMAVITCEQELEKYIDGLELKGFGGTDFRPVFEYVDEQIEHGVLNDLKGIIYFTDGLGTFPQKAPGYETAFVFVSDDADPDKYPEVPLWAAKIVLEQGDVVNV